jgi:hypothetical protein
VHVLSRHTTTGLTINESEERLLDDIRQARHAACTLNKQVCGSAARWAQAKAPWPARQIRERSFTPCSGLTACRASPRAPVQWLSKLAPASDPYLHNDLHLRPAPEVGWLAVGGWRLGWAPNWPLRALLLPRDAGDSL